MTISDGLFYFKYYVIQFILLLLLMENRKYILFSSISKIE